MQVIEQDGLDLRWWRPSGGFRFHLRRPLTHRAICGFEPSSPNAHQMMPRGRWVQEGGAFVNRCPKCHAIERAIERLLGRPC